MPLTSFDYPDIVRGYLASEEFNSVPDERKPLAFESFRKTFVNENEIKEDEDLKYVNDKSAEIFTSYRHNVNIPRFTPTPEQAADLYGQININANDPVEKRVKSIEDWRDNAVPSSAKKAPSIAEDFTFHVEDLANNLIKSELAKDSYKPGGMPDFLTDSAKRFTEQAIKGLGVDLLADYKEANRFFAKNLVENPEFDDNYGSQVIGGLGNVLSQVAFSAAMTAAGAPELVAPMLLTTSTARHMTEAYNRELKRTGNELIATDAAVNAIPAGILDAGPEIFLGGLLNKAKGFSGAYKAATTEAAKKAVIKEYLPSVVKGFTLGSLNEGIVGGGATHIAGNLGDYYATGDEQYLKNATNIAEIANNIAVEGTVGGLVGGGITGLTKGSNQANVSATIAQLSDGGRTVSIADTKAKELKIFDAIKAGNYDKAIEIANSNVTAKAPDKIIKGDTKPSLDPSGTPIKDKAEATLKERLGEVLPEQSKIRIANKPYTDELNKIEKDLDPVKDKDKLERLKKARGLFEKINDDGTSAGPIAFQEETEFESNDTNFILKGEDKQLQTKKPFDVTLNDDTKLKNDNVIYVKQEGMALVKNANLIKALGAPVTLQVTPNRRFVKFKGLAKRYEASVNPQVGWVPVVVTGNKIKILAPVKEANEITAKEPAEAIDPAEVKPKPSLVDDSEVIDNKDKAEFENLLEKKINNTITPTELTRYNELEKTQAPVVETETIDQTRIDEATKKLNKNTPEGKKVVAPKVKKPSSRKKKKAETPVEETVETPVETPAAETTTGSNFVKKEAVETKKGKWEVLDENGKETSPYYASHKSKEEAEDFYEWQQNQVFYHGQEPGNYGHYDFISSKGSNKFNLTKASPSKNAIGVIVGEKNPWQRGEDGILDTDNLLPGNHGYIDVNGKQELSKPTIVHKNGWTALAFVDRTSDKRTGAHGAFFTHGTLSIEEMLDRIDLYFPGLVENKKIRDQVNLKKSEQVLPTLETIDQINETENPNETIESIDRALELQNEILSDENISESKRTQVNKNIAKLEADKARIQPTVKPDQPAKPIDRGVLKNIISIGKSGNLTLSTLDDWMSRGFISEANFAELSEMFGVPEYNGDLGSFAQSLSVAIKKGKVKQPKQTVEQAIEETITPVQDTAPVKESEPDILDVLQQEVQQFRQQTQSTLQQQRENTPENIARRKEQTDRINELAKDVGLKNLRIVNTHEELNREDVDDAVQGFVEGSQVVMILDNIIPYDGESQVEAAERIFKHEVVGHLKLSRVLSGISKDGFNNLVTFLKTLKWNSGDSIWERTKAAYTTDVIPDDIEIVDEIFAKLTENKDKESVSIISKIVNWIRVKFLKAGIANWTTNDLDIIIQTAFDSELISDSDANVVNEDTITDSVSVVNEINNNIEEVLTTEEKSQAATELGFKKWNEEALSEFKNQISDWLVYGKAKTQALEEIFVKFLNSLKNISAAMIAAISINTGDASVTEIGFNQLNQSPVFPIESTMPNVNITSGFLGNIEPEIIPVSESNQSVPLKQSSPIKIEANFNGIKAHKSVVNTANEIINKKNNEGKPFIIGDKTGGLLYVFDANGNLKHKAPSLFGKEIGDSLTGDEKFLEKRVTPSGRFAASVGQADDSDYKYGKTLDFYESEDYTVAIHRVYLGKPEENRIDRLDSNSPKDNRVSSGCINVHDSVMDNVINPTFEKEGGFVYILPENRNEKIRFSKSYQAVHLDSNIRGYGAWVAPNGKITDVGYQDHLGKAIDIIGEEAIEGMTVTQVYAEMAKRGYLRVVNGSSILVDEQYKLNSSQKAVLQYAGMNSDKNVIIGDKYLYRTPAMATRFSRSTNQFDFRLADQLKDPENVMGLVVAKDGTLPSQNLAAKIKKSGATEFEVDTLTQLVNDLSKDGRVNMSELSEVIDTVPTVVINKLDVKEAETPDQIRFNEIKHELDSTDFEFGFTGDKLKILVRKEGNFEFIDKEQAPENIRKLYEEASGLKLTKDKSNAPATGRYGVDPYSKEQLKGREIEPGHRLIWSGDLSLNVPVKSSKQAEIDGVKKGLEDVNLGEFIGREVSPKFTSQHYSGDTAKNQLAFVRGGIHEYQAGNKLPDGTVATKPTRILEIWEVQSDWAATRKEDEKRKERLGLSDSTLNDLGTKETPLLNYWESLALKAAVNFAQEQGADKIITSDAETAMMTEGHDQLVEITPNVGDYILKPAEGFSDPFNGVPMWYDKKDSAEKAIKTGEKSGQFKPGQVIAVENKEKIPEKRPTQEPGMKAAYDERVPNGLKKITGSQPKKVTVGKHGKGKSEVFKKDTNTGYMFSVPQNRGLLRFSKSQPKQKAPVEPTEDNDLDWIVTDNEIITQSKSKASKEIAKLIKRTHEQKLIIKEIQINNAFKNVNYAFLNDSDVESFLNDYRDFVNTRNKQEDPATERIPVDVLEQRLIDYNKKANKNEYEFYASRVEGFPEFAFFNEDAGAARAYFKELTEEKNDDLASVVINDSDIATMDAVVDLQFQAIEAIDDISDIINRGVVDLDSSLVETGNPILDSGIPILKEQVGIMRKLFNEYALSLITTDATSLSGGDLRRVYYSLLSLVTDGYPNRLEGFISSETTDIIRNMEATFSDPYGTRKKNSDISKLESNSSQIERLATDGYSYDLLTRLQAPFREGLVLAKRYHEEVITPYIESLQRDVYNGVLDADTGHKIGMFGILRQRFLVEAPEQALKQNVQWILDSNKNTIGVYDRDFDAQGKRHQEYLEDNFLSGINYTIENGQLTSDFTPEDVAKFYQNANIFIGDKGIQYADGIVKMYDALKPLSKFTTEFIYGRPFEEIENYIPTMSVIIKGEGDTDFDIAKAQMLTDAKSFSSGQIFYGTNTSGLGSTKSRTRKIGTNRSLVFNINYAGESLGRIAVYDYFTAHARQEMSQLLNHKNKNGKLFAKFLGDPEQKRGRTDAFRSAMNGTWQNVMSQASYMHSYHVATNWVGRKWAQGVLSGLHQLPAQLVSNTTPYFVQHINEPHKIGNYFKAATYLLKHRMGMLEPHQARLVDKVIFEVTHRQQFQEIDKSVNLDINPSSLVEMMKKEMPYLYRAVVGVDKGIENILFKAFRLSDTLSGAPMALAEYLNAEQDSKGTHVRLEDLTYDPVSYIKAIDATERYIGIGDASRRGEYLTNKDAKISIARNLLIAFRSFSINNAVNFGKEMRRLFDSDVSREQKAQSFKYMMGIAAQSVTYTMMAYAVQYGMAAAIVHALKNPEEEEELKRLYSKSQNRMTKNERRTLNAEISMREKNRKVVQNIQNRTNNTRILSIKTVKDAASNMFIPFNLEAVPNIIIHVGSDGPEAETFKAWKKGEIDRIQKLIKRHKVLENRKTVTLLSEELANIQMQEFLPAVYEQRTIANIGGSFGGTVEGIVDAIESGSKFFQKPEAISPLDFVNLAAVIGVSQPDIKRYFRASSLIEKSGKEREEQLAAYEEETSP